MSFLLNSAFPADSGKSDGEEGSDVDTSSDAKSCTEFNITVFESAPKIGRSILRSGNGRCNITNACIETDLYHNPDFARTVFSEAEQACEDEKMLFATSAESTAYSRNERPSVDSGENDLPVSRGIYDVNAQSPADVLFFANREIGRAHV